MSSTTLETRLLKIWIIMVIPILSVLLAIVFVSVYKQQNNDVIKNVLKTVNESVDPCNNFYDFVCDKYISNTFTKYNGASHIDNFIRVNDEVRRNVTDILNEEIKKNEWELTILAKTFYKSCLNTGDVTIMHNEE
ncbi:hypothetical protein ILUMI_01199 [Ignelater luminosus]|uniref:Peptidase M13 N-terminal domain-containing protein n=1 Tax=Ignelater luminosus TaxID=2038154 RepID=A0A8K0GKH5_IGNLU|nr:hypothetical protein ILUMI_01199 [Ignelater luminosus]